MRIGAHGIRSAYGQIPKQGTLQLHGFQQTAERIYQLHYTVHLQFTRPCRFSLRKIVRFLLGDVDAMRPDELPVVVPKHDPKS